MTLYFEEEGEIKLPLECETLAKKVVEEALDYVNCPYEAQVNLLLTENEQIHEMNREFRGIDRATDVLSQKRKFLHRQKSTDTVRCENMLFLLRILCYT